MPVATMEAPALDVAGPRKRLSFTDWFMRVARRLGELFSRSTLVPMDPAGLTMESILERAAVEPLLSPQPVAVSEPTVVPSPAVEVTDGPATAAAPETMVPAVTQPLEAPKRTSGRARPRPPTNKDMLKRALDVLTIVERRLEHLEREVVERDVAIRGESGTSEDEASIAEIDDLKYVPY